MATIKVGMADLKICKAPDMVTTLGLGSCIGIAMYDPVLKIGGLAHIMLPDSTQMRNHSNIAKFADTGIEELLRQLIRAGANKRRLAAKIAGGAKMFEDSGGSLGNIGQRNIDSVRLNLKKEGIRLLKEDVGGSVARTLLFDPATGLGCVRSYGRKELII